MTGEAKDLGHQEASRQLKASAGADERLVFEAVWQTGDIAVYPLPVAYCQSTDLSGGGRSWRGVLGSKQLTATQVEALKASARPHVEEVRQALASFGQDLVNNPTAMSALRRLATLVAYEPWRHGASVSKGM